jgi:uncharacterized membrane protein YccC
LSLDAEKPKETWLRKLDVVHAARTAVTSAAAWGASRALQMPESYWAAITAMIVMQSSLEGAWKVSKQRFVGTACGALLGAVIARFSSPNMFIFGAGVFVLGIAFGLSGIDRNAFRYAGITLAIVVLVHSEKSAWYIALHRFIEISVGIAVALAVTAAWPEHEPQER